MCQARKKPSFHVGRRFFCRLCCNGDSYSAFSLGRKLLNIVYILSRADREDLLCMNLGAYIQLDSEPWRFTLKTVCFGPLTSIRDALPSFH